MIKHDEITVTVKEIGDHEYIGYISIVYPFQNLYCEISCDKLKLQQDLESKIQQLYGQFKEVREISIQREKRAV